MLMTEPRLPTGPDLGLEAQGFPLRVLVIGASAHTPGLLQQVGEVTGLGVETAWDPREALRRLREQSYDVVVVDLPYPQMTAEELFMAIVDVDPEQAGRVVFLANDLSDPATRRFLTEAGRPFLTQPVDQHQVYDLVMRVGLGESG
jgi:CheY-like chemotaxis protein